ncbi:hypothetical protein, partial [Klebsiella pneumoniae]|uniref:hypothetical protein n=1 Tax=Klebsiella pneumoniae TaxID=573 RepID=UPI003968E280
YSDETNLQTHRSPIEGGTGGGPDTTSDVPIVYGKKLRARLLAANRAKSTGDKIRALTSGFKFSGIKRLFCFI